MDNFDKAEKSGRALFTTLLQLLEISDYKESEEKYDTLDMYFTIKGKSAGVEIKKRDKLYEDYPTYMMEVYKFNALIGRMKDLSLIYYANFFGTNTLYIFPLRKIIEGIKKGTIEITSRYANRTTAAFSGKVEKLILLLPKEMATKLIRKGDKWYNPNKLNTL